MLPLANGAHMQEYNPTFVMCTPAAAGFLHGSFTGTVPPVNTCHSRASSPRPPTSPGTGAVPAKVPNSEPLARRFWQARVPPPLSRKLPALFSCERVSERPLRPRSRPPLALSTATVTDRSFPLQSCEMRAQSAVGYVRSKSVTPPDVIAASHKLNRALDRHVHDDTHPDFVKFR